MDKVKFLMSDTSAEVTAACREALELKGVEVTVVEKDGLKVLQKMFKKGKQSILDTLHAYELMQNASDTVRAKALAGIR